MLFNAIITGDICHTAAEIRLRNCRIYYNKENKDAKLFDASLWLQLLEVRQNGIRVYAEGCASRALLVRLITY